MKHLRWYLALILCFSSLQSYGFAIVYSTTDIPLVEGNNGVSVNMRDHGYNPRTDIAHSIKLLLSFREIIDNGDDWEAGTTEFVSFHAMMWGYRELNFGDVSTEIIDFYQSYTPGTDSCVVWDELGECVYDPVKSGIFGISMWIASSNLALDEVRWELDITRTVVDEPAPIPLLGIMLLCLIASRRNRYELQ